jgi:hypothetical protein
MEEDNIPIITLINIILKFPIAVMRERDVLVLYYKDQVVLSINPEEMVVLNMTVNDCLKLHLQIIFKRIIDIEQRQW